MVNNKSEKKVIIFTWCYDFGFMNYGQILQCYALYRKCILNGFNASVLRYRKLAPDENIANIPQKGEKRSNYEYERKKASMTKGEFDRITPVLDFINENIKRTEMCYTIEEVMQECEGFDYILIGSDQLWNPDWFLDVYCPDFFDNSKKIVSYATSGITNDIGKRKQVIRTIANRIEKFNKVSVREKICADILEKYIKKEIEVVLDPTIVLPREEWNKIASDRLIDEDYLLCFCYGDVQPQKHLLKEIANRCEGLDIYIVHMDQFSSNYVLEDKMHMYYGAGICELLSLIKFAKAVCTDSFHGFAFSIIFEKDFYLLKRAYTPIEDACPERMNELCRKFGVGNRWIKAKKDIESIEEINYEDFRMKKDKQIELSEAYIKKAFELS